MKYSHIREQLQDGDIALLTGSNLFSLLVRIFSAGSYSHVAVFFWEDNALYVSEVREFAGHRITHASTWIDEQLTRGSNIKIGLAPSRIRDNEWVGEFIRTNRTKIKRYSWWMLPVVWLSRVTNIRLAGNNGFICSHYVQKAWKHEGASLLPSNFEPLCDQTFNITEL